MNGPPAIDRASGWRGTAVWALATALAATSPLLAVIAAGRTFVTRDTVHLFEPLRPLIVSALREGRLPLWNPHEALGMPLLAQPQHAVFHPVTVLAALLAPRSGLEGVAVVHVALAALGAFALARHLGASRAGAAVAGLGFGLSGYVLAMTANLPYLAAAAAAPWALTALRWSAGAGSRLGVPLAAAACAVLFFAGDPQWALVTFVGGGALAWEHGGWRGLGRASLAVALGAALAAVQLAPTLAFLQETSRTSGGLSDAERAQWAFAPWRTLELVAPGFFAGIPGEGSAEVFRRLGGPNTYAAPFILSVHVGAVLLLLAVAGARASRTTRLLAGAAVACAWLAYGVHLGAEPLLRWVPVWGSFRYSEKLIGPFTLCVALLAAFGAERLAERRSTAGRVALGGAALALAGVAALAVGGDGLLAGWLGELAGVARTRLLVGLAHLLVGLIALAGALLAAGRPGVSRHLAAIAAALVLLQAVAAAPFALHAGAPGVREADPLRDVRAQGEVTRIATPSRSGANAGPPTLDALDRVVFQDSRMGVAPYAVSGGIDHVALYSPLWPARYERVFFAFLRDFDEGRWVAWRRFGLNRVVVDTRVTPQARRAAEAAVEGAWKLQPDAGLGFSVWETPHRPWASFASAVTPAASEEEAYQRLAASIWSGASDVVIEGAPPASAAPGRVLAAARGAEVLRIEAETAGDGVLVVNDAHWPGWTATLDGQPVPILRADVLVRAVAWPAGRHVLEMRYEPPEVRLGMAVSGAAAAVLLAWLGIALFRARARPADPG